MDTRIHHDLDFDRCYRALQARDQRFDGQFFVTVLTTGIYCRPSCPAQTPLSQNVRFVSTAAAAQVGGFRACRRCAPDAVPGSPRWNVAGDLSSRAMRLIADGIVERDGVDGLATRLGYSTRHLNRVLTDELGAGPLALARAHRATNARILIQCTSMPMADVAFAAGFASVRQFNDTIREVFALTPTRLRALRRDHRIHDDAGRPGGISLRLAYRAPMNIAWLGWFLRSHAADGVEDVTELGDGGWRYRRVIALPHGPALATVTTPTRTTPTDTPPAEAGFLDAQLEHLDLRDLGVAVTRLRRLLDLDADVAAAEDALRADPRLHRVVDAAAGIRVPGSVDGGETLIRTMIGQQISVAAARHHTGALVAALGERCDWPSTDAGTTTAEPTIGWHTFPTAAAIAAHGHDVLRGPATRIDAICAAAAELSENSMELHAGVAASDMHERLMTLRGVGRWTADYVTMRTTGDPDTLLSSDLVVRHAARDLAIDLDAETTAASRWAPWRSYASMHLWRSRLVPDSADPRTSTSPLIKEHSA